MVNVTGIFKNWEILKIVNKCSLKRKITMYPLINNRFFIVTSFKPKVNDFDFQAKRKIMPSTFLI